jgi:Leucine-rich repeat (LRR) protein
MIINFSYRDFKITSIFRSSFQYCIFCSKMKTKIIFLTIISLVSSDQIICNYGTVDGHYNCDATIENPSGSELLPITGTHQGYNEDYNVVRVNIYDGESSKMPSSFCTTFQYLKIIQVSFDVSMSKITANSFASCSELRELHLHNNYFSSIPSTFLSNSPKLLTFCISNYARDWNVNYLSNQGNLKELLLHNNNFRGFPSNTVTSNALVSLMLSNNAITILDEEPFGDLSKLEVLVITNNNMEAIDKRIFDQALSLREVRATGNICVDKDFPNFEPARDLGEFEACFDSFEPIDEGKSIKFRHR